MEETVTENRKTVEIGTKEYVQQVKEYVQQVKEWSKKSK
jgi:hypothetical protein